MNEIIKPVRYGILIGLLGLVFGIGWAVYLVVGHEMIHKSLEEKDVEIEERHGIFQLLEPASAHAHAHKKKEIEQPPAEHPSTEGITPAKEPGKEGEHPAVEAKPHVEGGHESPVMELVHERLARVHIHAMGLGLLTIAISFIIAFTGAPEMIKIIAPVLTGVGGLLYPLAWLVMGYRTPALGPDAAEASVTIIVWPGIALVLLGILTAMFFLLKDIFSPQNSV